MGWQHHLVMIYHAFSKLYKWTWETIEIHTQIISNQTFVGRQFFSAAHNLWDTQKKIYNTYIHGLWFMILPRGLHDPCHQLPIHSMKGWPKGATFQCFPFWASWISWIEFWMTKSSFMVFSALITEIRIKDHSLKMWETSKVQRFSQIFPPKKTVSDIPRWVIRYILRKVLGSLKMMPCVKEGIRSSREGSLRVGE